MHRERSCPARSADCEPGRADGLSSPAHRPFSGALLVLSYSGRRSGFSHSLPLQYARDGDKLVIMSGTASQKAWWRNFREPAGVTVTLAGKQTPWVAHVLTGREREEARAAYGARFRRVNTREDVEFVGLSPSQERISQ